MILKIINADRFVGTLFWNGTFTCLRVQTTDTSYRFQFKDRSPITRIIWIEVSRIGHWNRIEQEWEYRLNYPKVGSHVITAKWFEDYKNAMDTFGVALKEQLK